MRLLLALVITSLAGSAWAAPKADLWPKWQAHDDASTRTVDQSLWAGFLRAYLKPGTDGTNRVAYAAVSPADRAKLNSDVKRLETVPVSTLSQAEQRAYWTNLYNEVTVHVVLQHYPVNSIRNINLSSGLFAAGGPWDAKLVTIEGEPVSLNDIEHRILRPVWQDARTHYTLNCASLGCPNLLAEPYARATMGFQLQQAAADYVNSPRGYLVRDGALTVSSIYEWYQSDFGGTDAGVIEHLRRYSQPAKRATLDGIRSIKRDTYDWALNDAGAH